MVPSQIGSRAGSATCSPDAGPWRGTSRSLPIPASSIPRNGERSCPFSKGPRPKLSTGNWRRTSWRWSLPMRSTFELDGRSSRPPIIKRSTKNVGSRFPPEVARRRPGWVRNDSTRRTLRRLTLRRGIDTPARADGETGRPTTTKSRPSQRSTSGPQKELHAVQRQFWISGRSCPFARMYARCSTSFSSNFRMASEPGDPIRGTRRIASIASW